MTVHLKIIVQPSEDGGFTAFVSTIPSCSGEGDTREEAIARVRDAVTAAVGASAIEAARLRQMGIFLN